MAKGTIRRRPDRNRRKAKASSHAGLRCGLYDPSRRRPSQDSFCCAGKPSRRYRWDKIYWHGSGFGSQTTWPQGNSDREGDSSVRKAARPSNRFIPPIPSQEERSALYPGARLIQIANRYVLVEESGRERQIDADLVILGVGVSPNLDFEHDLPLAAEGGVLTDKSLRAADKVWVAGDIASISGIRIEHWRVAQQHERMQQCRCSGRRGRFISFRSSGRYHFGKRINYLGRGEEWNDISMTGDLRSFNFLALQSKSGVVRSVISCGRETETALLAELLHRPLSKQGAHTALRRL